MAGLPSQHQPVGNRAVLDDVLRLLVSAIATRCILSSNQGAIRSRPEHPDAEAKILQPTLGIVTNRPGATAGQKFAVAVAEVPCSFRNCTPTELRALWLPCWIVKGSTRRNCPPNWADVSLAYHWVAESVSFTVKSVVCRFCPAAGVKWRLTSASS